VKEKSVSAQEVSKAVKQFVSATLATRKTMQGQGQDLGGSWLAANDLNFFREIPGGGQARDTGGFAAGGAGISDHGETGHCTPCSPTGTSPKQTEAGSESTDEPIQKI